MHSILMKNENNMVHELLFQLASSGEIYFLSE